MPLKLFFTGIVIFIINFCAFSQQKEKPDKTSDTTSSSSCRIEVMQNTDSSYGYKIFVKDKLYINQPHIPAVPGVKSFKTKEDAQKIANFTS